MCQNLAAQQMPSAKGGPGQSIDKIFGVQLLYNFLTTLPEGTSFYLNVIFDLYVSYRCEWKASRGTWCAVCNPQICL